VQRHTVGLNSRSDASMSSAAWIPKTYVRRSPLGEDGAASFVGLPTLTDGRPVEVPWESDTANEEEDCRARTRAIMTSGPMQVTIASLIIANAVVIGFETDYSDFWAWDIIESCFLALFTCELSVRIAVRGCRVFFSSEDPDITWNIFDFTVILVGLFGAVCDILRYIGMMSGGGDISASTALRIVRLLRILRVFRIVRFLKQLYLLAFGFAEAIGAVFWITILMMGSIYVLSLVLVRTLGRTGSEDPHHKLLTHKFSNIPNAMMTLFELMSAPNFVDYQPLVMDRPIFGCFLVLYILFGSWGMIALLTGVVQHSMFVDSQVRMEQDRVDREAKRGTVVDQCEALFGQASVNDAGEASVEEIKALMPYVEQVFQRLRIPYDQHDLANIVTLMDQDASGLISKEEFLHGILSLSEGLRAFSIQEICHNLAGVYASVKSCENYSKEAKEINTSTASVHQIIVDRLTSIASSVQSIASATAATTEWKVMQHSLEEVGNNVRDLVAAQGRSGMCTDRCEAAIAGLQDHLTTLQTENWQLMSNIAELTLDKDRHDGAEVARPVADTREEPDLTSCAADNQWRLANVMLSQIGELTKCPRVFRDVGLAADCNTSLREAINLVAEVKIQVAAPPTHGLICEARMPSCSELACVLSPAAEVAADLKRQEYDCVGVEAARSSVAEQVDPTHLSMESYSREGKRPESTSLSPACLARSACHPQKVEAYLGADNDFAFRADIARVIAEVEVRLHELLCSWVARLLASQACKEHIPAAAETPGSR